MSHDLLEDLLADVPRHVTADPAAAWRAGTRRRRRTYAAEGLAVAAALVLGALAVTQLHPPAHHPVGPAGKVAKTAGYPMTVERPFFDSGHLDGPAAGLVAAGSMTVGNVLALLQNNLKRMLAYSGVAHAGYLAMGLAAGTGTGVEALLFYLVAYGLMTVGAFAVLAAVDTDARPVETIDDLAGLAQDRPWLAGLFAVALVSLIGLPLTAGFAGKFMLFMSALQVERSPDTQPLFVILAVVAALNGAIGAYYYLRIVAVMFLREPLKPLRPATRIPAMAAIGLCAAVTLVFGVYPLPLAKMAQAAAGLPSPPVAQASR